MTGHRCARLARMGDEAQLIARTARLAFAGFHAGDACRQSHRAPSLGGHFAGFEDVTRTPEIVVSSVRVRVSPLGSPLQRARFCTDRHTLPASPARSTHPPTRPTPHQQPTSRRREPRPRQPIHPLHRRRPPASWRHLSRRRSHPWRPSPRRLTPRLSGARKQSGGVARSLGSPSCDGPARTRESTVTARRPDQRARLHCYAERVVRRA